MIPLKGGDIVYSVWVGGGEVNAYALSKSRAEEIAEVWTNLGYEDVVVQRIDRRGGN